MVPRRTCLTRTWFESNKGEEGTCEGVGRERNAFPTWRCSSEAPPFSYEESTPSCPNAFALRKWGCVFRTDVTPCTSRTCKGTLCKYKGILHEYEDALHKYEGALYKYTGTLNKSARERGRGEGHDTRAFGMRRDTTPTRSLQKGTRHLRVWYEEGHANHACDTERAKTPTHAVPLREGHDTQAFGTTHSARRGIRRRTRPPRVEYCCAGRVPCRVR